MKPRAHSIAYKDGENSKTKQSAKGVNRAVKTTLHCELFKSVLFDKNTDPS